MTASAKTYPIDRFMVMAEELPVFDVRTPSEFAKGHIPGAYNLALFSDEERSRVGKAYAKFGKKRAILQGLDYVGPKMRQLVEYVETVTDRQDILIHCWRGGMRSSSVAWLLDLYDYQTYLLEGGYKAFRRYILRGFELSRNIIILSGRTGSGKTEILEQLRENGEQVINLENLANHKGSSFGGLGKSPPPSQEQFENELGMQWRQLDPALPVWLEDESQRIGSITIPRPLWQQMRNTLVIFLDIPIEKRIERLVQEYGLFQSQKLKKSVKCLEKRLGGLQTKGAIAALDRGDLAACCEILLRHYYDKTYQYGLSQRDENRIYRIGSEFANPGKNAREILSLVKTLHQAPIKFWPHTPTTDLS